LRIIYKNELTAPSVNPIRSFLQFTAGQPILSEVPIRSILRRELAACELARRHRQQDIGKKRCLETNGGFCETDRLPAVDDRALQRPPNMTGSPTGKAVAKLRAEGKKSNPQH
jgi:hypothetical protein